MGEGWGWGERGEVGGGGVRPIVIPCYQAVHLIPISSPYSCFDGHALSAKKDVSRGSLSEMFSVEARQS